MIQQVSLKEDVAKVGSHQILGYKKNYILVGIIFLSTLFLRFNEYYTYRDFNSDKARQLHGAYNLLEGKGVSFESYDLRTFENQLKPIIDWPPAYSYITAGISVLAGTDLYTASVILDLITILGLWFVLFWIMQMLNFTLLQSVLLYLFLAVSKTPLQFLFSADLLGAVLFLASFGLILSFIHKKIGRSVFYILQFVLIGLMVFLKYSVFPAAIALGVSFISYSIFVKKAFIKDAVILLTISIILISAVFVYNNMVSGDMIWMDKEEEIGKKVWKFSSLLMFNPFLAITLFYPGPLFSLIGYSLVRTIQMAFTIGFLGWFIFFIGNRIVNKRSDYFEHLIFFCTLCVIGYLSLASLYYTVDTTSNGWTFVAEYRYYAPLILLFIIFLFRNFVKPVKKIYSYFMIYLIIVFSLTYAIAVKVYYTAIDNKAESFNNLYGKMFAVADHVKGINDPNTFFVSITGNPVIDAQVTSLTAASGVKVSMSYYGYFDKNSLSPIFSSDVDLKPGKKIILYVDQNKSIIDSLNIQNKYSVESLKDGQQLFVIQN